MADEEEGKIDIKGTLEKLVKADEPELEQEEAIRRYEDAKPRKKNNSGESQEDATEEQEHLKRVKQELLASLERVKALEKKLYGEIEKEDRINVKRAETGATGGKGKSQHNQKEQNSNENIAKDKLDTEIQDKQMER